MNEQDKQLLLQDLCGRLPYGVKVDVIMAPTRHEYPPKMLFAIAQTEPCYDILDLPAGDSPNTSWRNSGEFKPYLRPMSSMTEEEMKEYRKTQNKEVVVQYPCTAAPNEVVIWCSTASTYDYLNSIHVDYRGLIPKGLALPAPEGMYNNDNNENTVNTSINN